MYWPLRARNGQYIKFNDYPHHSPLKIVYQLLKIENYGG